MRYKPVERHGKHKGPTTNELLFLLSAENFLRYNDETRYGISKKIEQANSVRIHGANAGRFSKEQLAFLDEERSRAIKLRNRLFATTKFSQFHRDPELIKSVWGDYLLHVEELIQETHYELWLYYEVLKQERFYAAKIPGRQPDILFPHYWVSYDGGKEFEENELLNDLSDDFFELFKGDI